MFYSLRTGFIFSSLCFAANTVCSLHFSATWSSESDLWSWWQWLWVRILSWYVLCSKINTWRQFSCTNALWQSNNTEAGLDTKLLQHHLKKLSSVRKIKHKKKKRNWRSRFGKQSNTLRAKVSNSRPGRRFWNSLWISAVLQRIIFEQTFEPLITGHTWEV